LEKWYFLSFILRIQDLINPKLELSNLTGFQNLSGLVSAFIKSAFLSVLEIPFFGKMVFLEFHS